MRKVTMVGGALGAVLLKSLVWGLLLAVASTGAHAGELSINASGQPNYELPITVPPGIGGMAPKMSLYFDTSVTRGSMGVGWSLKGLSLITRCRGSKLIDGLPQGVRYSPNDKLCLDGKRLVQTDAAGAVINAAVVNPGPANPFQQSDSLGGTTREFRTETDSHARIRSYGSASSDPASGPATFKVWTKDGSVYEYTSKNVITAERTVAVMWLMSRITDTVGNYMEFRYLERNFNWGSATAVVALVGDAGREWNIDQILYTGNGSQQPTSRMVFEYSDRADTPGAAQQRSESYNGGFKTVVIRKLDKIQTYINWPADQVTKPAGAIKVTTFKLNYGGGAPLTGRTMLRDVTKCVGAGETACSKPTAFYYEQGGFVDTSGKTRAKLEDSYWYKGEVLHTKDNKIGVLVADFNGDGRDDILKWSDKPAENKLLLSDHERAIATNFASNFNILDQNLFKSDGCYRTLVMDVNGDGLPDLLRFSSVLNNAGGGCGTPVNYIYRNKGDGSFDRLTYNGPALERVVSVFYYHPQYRQLVHSRGANFFLVDFDRDGKVDIITTQLPPWISRLTITDPCASMICTRVYRGNGDGSFGEISTNIANKSIYVPPGSVENAGSPKNIIDVNADGFPDLVGIEATEFTTTSGYTSRGDGNFDASLNWPVCTNMLDFNGDGLPDCLVASTDVTKNRLLLNDGQTGQPRSVTTFNLTHAGEELYGVGLGFMIMDFNEDGLDDIVRWKDDIVASPTVVYYSNGDGTFRNGGGIRSSWNDRLMTSDNGALSIRGDFTGNGRIQFLRLLDEAQFNGGDPTNKIYKMQGSQPDRLIYVTGEDEDIRITWGAFHYSLPVQTYLSDRGTANAAVYPNVDLVRTMPLVASTTTYFAKYDGTNDAHSFITTYRYFGLKMSYKDLGGLGFREVRRTVAPPSETPLTYMSQFVQNGTHTGSVSISETRIDPSANVTARVLNRTTNVYCDMTAAVGAQATATYLAPCPTTAKVRRPYLYTSKAEAWDLNGAALPVVTQTNTYNQRGGVTQSLVRTEGTALGISQSFTRSMVNTYHPDNVSNDNWLLGKLKLTTVQNSVPNSIGSIATSAGSAPNAAATSGVAR